ncbi:hypothetical protein H4R20_000363 [Coemansia guatemalensis]|uniref:Uncharacterized protein n=1 Tax=Coemansia guatemalensis TaxID=2761395 RepID=A0A9W8HZC8_9FUNG|nr:hypothetical protein H4R20_000363 [Coemansia guatemalensis]
MLSRFIGASQRPLLTAQLKRGFQTGRIVTSEDGTHNNTDKSTNPEQDIQEDVDVPQTDLSSVGASAVSDTRITEETQGKRRGRQKINRNIGFKQWLKTEGVRFKKAIPHAVHYIEPGRRPFPLNPAFRPRSPLTDQLKEAIYKKYLEDPLRNTPRVLGDNYKVSIKRIEAILKLKAIEYHMVKHEGFVPQKKFTNGMESIMGVQKGVSVLKEVLVPTIPRISSPRFYAVPEGTSFNAEDAAEILGRKPYQEILDRLGASKPFTVDYEGLDPKFAPHPKKKLSNAEKKRLDSLGSETDEVIEESDVLTNRRWKFVFTDISKNSDMKDRFVLIREKDGTLKKANRDYKLKRYGLLWYH